MHKPLIGLVVLVVLVAAGLFFMGTPAQAPTELPTNTNEDDTMNTTLSLTSTAFRYEGAIPSTYTCDGENSNPPLSISGVPEEAVSLVLIMDDPDAIKPAGKVWDHWVVFNITREAWNIEQGTLEIREGEEPEGVLGTNSGGELGYQGPCPPDAEHRYFFKVFALDTALDLAEGATKSDVEAAMGEHVLAEGQLMGRYERQ